MGSVAGFLPSLYGLPYPNAWPDVPDKTFVTPVGTIEIMRASNGLCGGMAFAARDLFEVRRLAPSSAQNPDSRSPAFNFLVDRLIDSWNIPEGVVEFCTWMGFPPTDEGFPPLGVGRQTIEEAMPEIRAAIDAGHPCPVGLICVHSTDPADLRLNHQVLAWGYDDVGTTTTVRVYDPNHPLWDDVTITYDSADPGHAQFAYSPGDRTVLGFFVLDYEPRDPAPLFDT